MVCVHSPLSLNQHTYTRVSPPPPPSTHGEVVQRCSEQLVSKDKLKDASHPLEEVRILSAVILDREDERVVTGDKGKLVNRLHHFLCIYMYKP